jgi:HD superfamily phosphohydrolase
MGQMKTKGNLRYDPLYRVIDEIEEMRYIEGKFKQQFDRLKRINNLGIIPEIFEMAKYPKYEHGLGTVHQVNSLLEIVDKNTIPDRYRRPLVLSALFLHLGHIPYTYSTERALLLACNLGNRESENIIKLYLRKRINKVFDKGNIKDELKSSMFEDLFTLRDYKLLYRYFSCSMLIDNWGHIKNKYGYQTDDELEIIINDLIDKKGYGYRYLNMADKADFVQRDALYFGTVRLDISPKHLYRGLSKYSPKFAISEELLIEANHRYLSERFYDNSEVMWYDRLYEKIVASLMISSRFNLTWLEKYDDIEFKNIICNNRDKDNKNVGLPKNWVRRARDLFEDKYNYINIFNLSGVWFKKENDVIDVEYEIIGKDESERGLLSYPFDTGILVYVDYLKEHTLPVYPKNQLYSISIFQEDSKRDLSELLKVIGNIICNITIAHVDEIRTGIANQLSWTSKSRFDNDAIIKTIGDAVLDIELENKRIGSFIENCLRDLSSISAFSELWQGFENEYFWKQRILNLLRHQNEKLDKQKESSEIKIDEINKSEIYVAFAKGLLSLPTKLLQYVLTKQYLDEIYTKLLKNISLEFPNDKKGDIFEALCLIDRVRTKQGKFQFFLNGMVVVDPLMPNDSQDYHEYDIIEFIIRDSGNAECGIYACSIVDDPESKDKEAITDLVDYIHRIYPDLIIQTYYMVPKNKQEGDWNPIIKGAGRGYNLRVN